ncbi:MAG: aminoglycoside phosphotransferase family protein [Pseudodonghicola sp.]
MSGAATDMQERPAAMIAPPVASFLARHGHAGQPLEPLVADASARRYFRLPGKGLLLMEDRSDPVGFAAYLRLSRHLLALGLSVPRVHGADPSTGLALVEDFGNGTYAACLAGGQDEAELYRLAVSTLLHLHRDPRAAQVSQPGCDLETLLDEVDLFSHWFAPVAFGAGFETDAFAAQFRALWREALAPVATRRDTLILRDFHIDNLMLLPDRDGVRRCGLLDFQDGVIGACEYDLVSLLQDARRDLAPGLEAKLLALYIDNAPQHLGSAEQIRARYALLGAQRHTRIAGVFLRLCQQDGKPRYLHFLPRVLRQLDRALRDAALTGIADFLTTELPDWAGQGDRIAARLTPTTTERPNA